MKHFRVSLLPLAFVLFAFSHALAQGPAQPTLPAQTGPSNLATDDMNAKPPFCDIAIPKALEELQKNAESTCKTATTCVHCTDKKTGTEVYATIYAQPKNPKCDVATGVTYEVAKGGATPLRVYFEILQSVCTREGVSLALSFPDSRVNTSLYAIVWEIDGRVAGQGDSVNCVCGKAGSVTITEKSTGRQIKKYMNLTAGCNTSKN